MGETEKRRVVEPERLGREHHQRVKTEIDKIKIRIRNRSKLSDLVQNSNK